MELTYEQAIKRLEEIVSQLSNNTATLEGSLEIFSEGALLIKQCEEMLNKANEKLEVLMPNEGN